MKEVTITGTAIPGSCSLPVMTTVGAGPLRLSYQSRCQLSLSCRQQSCSRASPATSSPRGFVRRRNQEKFFSTQPKTSTSLPGHAVEPPFQEDKFIWWRLREQTAAPEPLATSPQTSNCSHLFFTRRWTLPQALGNN